MYSLISLSIVTFRYDVATYRSNQAVGRQYDIADWNLEFV